MSPSKSAVKMDAEMTLHNLIEVIDSNIKDYEILDPSEILQANSDLLLHYLNHSATLSLSDRKLLNQLAAVKKLVNKKGADSIYTPDKIAYNQLLIAIAEL